MYVCEDVYVRNVIPEEDTECEAGCTRNDSVKAMCLVVSALVLRDLTSVLNWI